MPEHTRTMHGPWRRPAVQRRTFTSADGVSHAQWGIRDAHGTWQGHRSRQAALAAAFGEEAA